MNPQGAGVVEGENMFGQITALSTATSSVTINSIRISISTGSSRSSWVMTLAGVPGPNGADGPSGVGYNYTTSSSAVKMGIVNTNTEKQFTVTTAQVGNDAFGVGDRIRCIALDAPATDYYFMAGYLAAKTGTNWTVNIDTQNPGTSTSVFSSWKFALTGDVATQTSQAVHFFNTSNATSTLTGGLVLDGGLGVGKSAFIGQWLVPMSMTSATAKSYTGTPTGATVFLTGTGYNKPAYYDGTKWYLTGGTALY
jgi:hypothetical protein